MTMMNKRIATTRKGRMRRIITEIIIMTIAMTMMVVWRGLFDIAFALTPTPFRTFSENLNVP